MTTIPGTRKHTVDIPSGPIDVFETGSGRPIVFIHGLMASPLLWAKVVPLVGAGYRSILPLLPLGAHERAMKPDADLSPRGLARVIADLLDALDVSDVVLVANDTGGALCQLLLTERPGRIGAVLFTNCDTFDNFPPKMFVPLCIAGRSTAMLGLLARMLSIGAIRNLPVAFGWLSKNPIEPDVAAALLRPLRENPDVRRDTAKVFTHLPSHELVANAERLHAFDRPVLFVWAKEDRFFPPKDADRLAKCFPNTRRIDVDDSYTFVPLDQPDILARHLRELAGSTERRAQSA